MMASVSASCFGLGLTETLRPHPSLASLTSLNHCTSNDQLTGSGTRPKPVLRHSDTTPASHHVTFMYHNLHQFGMTTPRTAASLRYRPANVVFTYFIFHRICINTLTNCCTKARSVFSGWHYDTVPGPRASKGPALRQLIVAKDGIMHPA